MALARLTLTAPADEVEALAALLEAHGAGSVALLAASEEPVFDDRGLWAETRIEALFEDQGRAQAAAGVLAAGPFPDWELTPVPERDWVVVWKEGLVPRCFGGRLWVHPSWSVPDDAPGLRLVIDPGMAFGTGQHPTTALCLEWLALAGGITDCEALDYGCGSGILALAALRLGARRVLAVDCDEKALAVTRENAANNGLTACLVAALPQDLGAGRVDLIVANLLLQPLIDLAPRFADLLGCRGRLVMSGILAEQVSICAAAYQGSFRLAPAVLSGEWALLSATRRS